jgi:hypothetical protein
MVRKDEMQKAIDFLKMKKLSPIFDKIKKKLAVISKKYNVKKDKTR